MKKNYFHKKDKKKLDKGGMRWYTKTRRLRGRAEKAGRAALDIEN